MDSDWDTLADPSEAETVAKVFTLTTFVEIAKVAVLLPAGIVKLAGTAAVGELLEIPIARPAAGAAPARLTVPVLALPPVTEDGLRESAARVAGVMVILTVLLTEPNLAVMVAVVRVVTPWVVMTKLPDFDPADTATVLGTVTDLAEELRLTDAPAEEANPVRVTVPELTSPPATEVGEALTLLRAAAAIVNTADLVVPPPEPEIFDVVVLATPEVLTEKVAVVDPEATATVEGTVA